MFLLMNTDARQLNLDWLNQKVRESKQKARFLLIQFVYFWGLNFK
jgi:hypothetical protein